MRKGDRHPPFSHRRGETDARLAGSRSANRDHDASVTEARPPDRRWQTLADVRPYGTNRRLVGNRFRASGRFRTNGSGVGVRERFKKKRSARPSSHHRAAGLIYPSIHLSIAVAASYHPPPTTDGTAAAHEAFPDARFTIPIAPETQSRPGIPENPHYPAACANLPQPPRWNQLPITGRTPPPACYQSHTHPAAWG